MFSDQLVGSMVPLDLRQPLVGILGCSVFDLECVTVWSTV